ncbi:MAG: hypothetical protein L3J39_16870 [Verrucomicrobiales bacterium]|nr:hypothetical protein [Verrucomicrobiales bacterium]
MRTTIDLPDALVKRIKFHTTNNKVTFRSLLITALEKELSVEKKPFRLRDASVGNPQDPSAFNQTISQYRNPSYD